MEEKGLEKIWLCQEVLKQYTDISMKESFAQEEKQCKI